MHPATEMLHFAQIIDHSWSGSRDRNIAELLLRGEGPALDLAVWLDVVYVIFLFFLCFWLNSITALAIAISQASSG